MTGFVLENIHWPHVRYKSLMIDSRAKKEINNGRFLSTRIRIWCWFICGQRDHMVSEPLLFQSIQTHSESYWLASLNCTEIGWLIHQLSLGWFFLQTMITMATDCNVTLFSQNIWTLLSECSGVSVYYGCVERLFISYLV